MTKRDLPVQIKRHHRFLTGHHITFLSLRWSRTYGITTDALWQDGRWLGSGSWRRRGPFVRCKYGYRPKWLAARPGLVRALEAVSLRLPTAAGRSARFLRDLKAQEQAAPAGD